MHRRLFTAIALSGAVWLAGCATTRSELPLPPPQVAPPAAGAPASGGQTFVIRSVRDERVFEEKPDDPSTPSLGFGGAAKAGEEVRLRAIGRKRGGFGMAFGDVLLQPGQTVESVVRDNLAAALRQAGHQVLSDPAAAPAGAQLLDVHIKALWSWMNPGFWTITANGRVITEVDVAGWPGSVRVAAEHQESRLAMTETAWLETMTKALAAWRAEAAKQLAP